MKKAPRYKIFNMQKFRTQMMNFVKTNITKHCIALYSYTVFYKIVSFNYQNSYICPYFSDVSGNKNSELFLVSSDFTVVFGSKAHKTI